MRRPEAFKNVSIPDIVGQAELGGCDRKSGGFGGHDQVAGEHGLGRSAPDTPSHHGHYRSGVVLDLAHELAQRVVLAERVTAALGQFIDIVPG
jgi:hypothetical protein